MIKRLKQLNFKKYLIVTSPILFILVIVGGYWGYENYQGARHLNEIQKLITKEGAVLKLSDLHIDLPDPSENFATSKYISAVLDYDDKGNHARPADRDRFRLAIEIPDELVLPIWETGRPFSINEIDSEVIKHLKGKNALEKLKSVIETDFDVIQEIDSMVDCRSAAFIQPLNEEQPIATVLPHITDLRRFSQFNLLRAYLAIAEGDRETALVCFKTNQQLVELCNSTTNLISMLIQNVLIRHSESIIWQGMVNELWQPSDYQLFINQLLTTEKRCAEMLRQINGELIFSHLTFESLTNHRLMDKRDVFRSLGTDAGWLAFAPKGIWQHNNAYCQNAMLHDMYLPLKNNFTLPHTPPPSTFPMPSHRNHPRTFLFHLFSGPTIRVIESAKQSLVYEKLTRTACAIHLRQLESGELPKSLSELVPEYLENVDDLMNPGNPLVYRIDSKAKQHWTIYSVGIDGTDDGGKVEWKNPRRRDHARGDWVWSAPGIQHP